MANPEVEKVCKKAPNYNFCIETFNSDPRSGQATDLKALAKILFEISMARAQDVINKDIPKFRREIKDETVLSQLRSCEYNYDAIFSKFHGALPTSEKGDYNGVAGWINDGKQLITGCDNNNGDQPLTKSPMADVNRRILDLVALILSVNDMLKGGAA